MLNTQIQMRLDFLELALKEINDAFSENRKDTFLEVGGEYEKEYPIIPGEKDLYKEAEILTKKRREILYYRIFCFTQVYYSLKDYLKKIYPKKKRQIESFFSDDKIGSLTRKELSNDLKHNPKNDLKFGLVELDRKIEKKNKKNITTIYNNWNWHLKGVDSKKHCNELYQDILDFIKYEIDV